MAESSFGRAAVQLAKTATPVPPGQLLLCPDTLAILSQDGKYGCQWDELSAVREELRVEQVLLVQEFRRCFETMRDHRSKFLIFRQLKAEHVGALAPNSGETFLVYAFAGCGFTPCGGCQQCDRLQKVRIGDIAQNSILGCVPSPLALLPMLSEIELVRGVGCGE